MYFRDIRKSTINLANDISVEGTQKIIKVALACLRPSTQDLPKLVDKLSLEKDLPKDHIHELLAMFIKVLKYFVNSTDKEFNQNLLELGFTNEFIDNLPLTTNRKELVGIYFTPSYESFQNLASTKWKLDISLQSSSLGEKILPNIILAVQLKNGDSYTIELNLVMFHKLRFNIALLIKETAKLKSSSVITNIIK